MSQTFSDIDVSNVVVYRPKWYSLLIILNEAHKVLLIHWSYKFNLATLLGSIVLMFVGISLFKGDGNLESNAMASSFIGYIIWYYFLMINRGMNLDIREESQAGTLEQMYMSPVPLAIIEIGHAISTLLVATTFITIATAPLIWLLQIPFSLRWDALPVFILTIADIYGFALIIGGITVLFKQITDFVVLIQILFMFFNGSFLPVDRFPNWLAIIAQMLPTTQGIIILRKVLLAEQPLTVVWLDGSLIWLIIHTVASFGLGWLVFSICERIAKQKGLLSHY